MVLHQSPLSQWRQQGTYDSAKECEATRREVQTRDDRVHSTITNQYMESERNAGESPTSANLALRDGMKTLYKGSAVESELTTASRCVASDDPRLAR